MFKFIIMLSIFLIPILSHGSEWVSPIDGKYAAKNSELFLKFDHARKILNSWSGEIDKLQTADSILSDVIKQDKQYAPAYREYGRLYIMAGYINDDNFKGGRLNPAEQSILTALQIEPNDGDSYVLLGHLYTNMDRYHDAEVALTNAERIATDSPWLNLNWADLLIKQEKYPSAIQRYQQVVESKTSNRKAYASALAGLTKMHRYMNQYDAANTAFKNELAYSPDSALIWGNYASFLLFRYKDVDGAITKGRQAIKLMDYAMGRSTLGAALYTKWAMLKDNPATSLQAQQYFDEAWLLYPHLEKIITKTKRYDYTRITAVALSKL